MDSSKQVISDRHFGGIGILWRKALGSLCTVKALDYTRLMAIEISNGKKKCSWFECLYMLFVSNNNYERICILSHQM